MRSYDDFPARTEHRVDRLHECLSANTRIVSLTAGSNVLGFTTDVEIILKQLEQHRGKKSNPQVNFILDIAQLAAHQVIDITAGDKFKCADSWMCVRSNIMPYLLPGHV